MTQHKKVRFIFPMRKNVLRLGLYSIILLWTIYAEAQGQRGQSQNRGQGQRGQSQNRAQGQQSMPQFNAENATGILTYNYRRVIKKTKLVKDEEKDSVKKSISAYNHTIDEIKSLHADEFRVAERFVTKGRQEAMANKDRETMRLIQSETMKKLSHIRRKVLKAEQELNGKLKKVFSEEQYNKWLNFQESKKQGLKPKRPGNTGGGNARPGNAGGRRGNF